MKKSLSILAGLLFFGACISPIHANLNQTPDTFPLQPYSATYSISWHGMKVGSSTQRLISREDGLYHVEVRTTPLIKMLPYKQLEKTDFSWENGNVKPINYYYDIQDGRKHKKGNVSFDWEHLLVSNKVSKEPWEKEMTQDTQSKVTQYIKMRIDLNDKTKGLAYLVAEDNEIKAHTFTVIGTDIIPSVLGTLNTLKVVHRSKQEAKSLMWLSVEHQFLPIKVEHYRHDKKVGSGELTSYQVQSDSPTQAA